MHRDPGGGEGVGNGTKGRTLGFHLYWNMNFLFFFFCPLHGGRRFVPVSLFHVGKLYSGIPSRSGSGVWGKSWFHIGFQSFVQLGC